MVFSGFPFTIDNDLKRTGMFALRPASPVMPLALDWWPVAPDLTSVLNIPLAQVGHQSSRTHFQWKKTEIFQNIKISRTIHDFFFWAI